MKIIAVLIALIALLGLPLMAVAASYSYYVDITVTNTSGSTISNSAVFTPLTGNTVNNSNLLAAGYFGNSILNSDLQSGGSSIAYTPITDRTAFYIGSLANNATASYRYLMNNSPAQSSTAILLGVDGYVTTADAPALEPGNDFEIEISGYVNTAAGANKNLVLKTDAFRTYVSGAGSITAAAPDTVTYSNDTQNAISILGGAYNTRIGERYNNFPITTITQAQFYLRSVLAPAGFANVSVRRVSDDVAIGFLGTIDVTTIGAAFAWYTFTTDVANPAVQDIRIAIEYGGGDAANYIQVGYQGADVLATGDYTIYNGAVWAEFANDATIRTYPEVSVTANPVSSGAHVVNTALSGGTLSLIIDGGAPVSTALPGTLPDTANDWIIGQQYVLPYITYYQYTVGGVLVVWYQPVAIITGTTLPDRQGAAQDGVITWFSATGGVTVVVSKITVANAPAWVSLSPGGTSYTFASPLANTAALYQPTKAANVNNNPLIALMEQPVVDYGILDTHSLWLLITALIMWFAAWKLWRLGFTHGILVVIICQIILVAPVWMGLVDGWVLFANILGVTGIVMLDRSFA